MNIFGKYRTIPSNSFVLTFFDFSNFKKMRWQLRFQGRGLLQIYWSQETQRIYDILFCNKIKGDSRFMASDVITRWLYRWFAIRRRVSRRGVLGEQQRGKFSNYLAKLRNTWYRRGMCLQPAKNLWINAPPLITFMSPNCLGVARNLCKCSLRIRRSRRRSTARKHRVRILA